MSKDQPPVGADVADQPAAAATTAPPAQLATLKRQAIVPSTTNPRTHFDSAYIIELGDSLATHGFLQPILVRPLPAARLQDTFEDRRKGDPLPTHEIVCGECRYRASELRDIDDIPVLIRHLTDLQVLQVQLVENLKRKDLHPLEEAEGFQRLITDHGMTVQDIADNLDKRMSVSQVYATLKLLDLTPECRQELYAGKLTRSTALLVARAPAHLQLQIAKDIMRPNYEGETMSYRAAARHIHEHYMLQLSAAVFDIKDASLVPKAGACPSCPKRTGCNADMFEDVKQADTCTDPKCFDQKKEAHYAAVAAKAQAKGQVVIQGKEALELMPHEYSTKPKGYTLLDEKSYVDGRTQSVRKRIGKDNLPPPVIIVNPHTKQLQEALPDAVASKLLAKAAKEQKKQAQDKPPTEEELKRQYEDGWKTASIKQIYAAILAGKMQTIPVQIARHIAAYYWDVMGLPEVVTELLNPGPIAKGDAIAQYIRDCPDDMVAPTLLLLMMAEDIEHAWGRSENDASYPVLALLAEQTGIDIQACQDQVKADMRAAAQAREQQADKPKAGEAKPAPGKPAQAAAKKPAAPKKLKGEEASKAISTALQQAEAEVAAAAKEKDATQPPVVVPQDAWPFPRKARP